MIAAYAAYLDGDFSLDYWSDEGINHAGFLLKRFTISDWMGFLQLIAW
jgi:hypothetical protein